MHKKLNDSDLASMVFRPFRIEDQIPTKSLILAGLGDHFAKIDPTLNPDIDDIWHNYIELGGFILIVEIQGSIIGTGGLIPEDDSTGRIVRVSVSIKYRRLGIGRSITQHLVDVGRKIGYSRIVVETNDDWHGAINLYKQCGFSQYDHHHGEVHLSLVLGAVT